MGSLVAWFKCVWLTPPSCFLAVTHAFGAIEHVNKAQGKPLSCCTITPTMPSPFLVS